MSGRAIGRAAGAVWMLCAVYAHALDRGGVAPVSDRANSSVKSLAATCAGCHGTDGRGTRDSAIPSIAGLPPAVFLERMRGFREGVGSPTVMRQIAAGYDEDQVRALAEYFAGVGNR